MKKKKFLAKGLSSGCREGGKRFAFPVASEREQLNQLSNLLA
jgi:hypothetical protein